MASVLLVEQQQTDYLANALVSACEACQDPQVRGGILALLGVDRHGRTRARTPHLIEAAVVALATERCTYDWHLAVLVWCYLAGEKRITAVEATRRLAAILDVYQQLHEDT